jgi:hypothetical protein
MNGCAKNRISPTGSSCFYLSSPAAKNILLPVFGKSLSYFRRPAHSEGRFAIVTDVGAGCGGRGGALDEQRSSGRRSRVVLTPRRWRQVGS